MREILSYLPPVKAELLQEDAIVLTNDLHLGRGGGETKGTIKNF